SEAGGVSNGGRNTTGRAGTGGVTTGGTTASNTASKSAGCGKAAPLSAPKQQSVTIGTASRGYFLVPPTAYDSNVAYPIVFAFHGAGGNGEGLRGYFQLEAAAKGAAIFVYPDGIGGIWDLKNDGSDAQMFDSIVATLEASWCVETASIFATGFSYGGWAATQMAVSRPTVVRAIASIEGGGPQGGKSSNPAVAAMIIHGTADTAEPIASGISSRDHFVATNGCSSTSSAVTPSPCVAYSGCATGKPVEWCQHSGAHEIPDFATGAIWGLFNSLR
ncbi:MAG TPA: Ricin and poly(3-hydroxybutyrate) depolymerase fusion, partial [Polyangiaceae bacterium]